MRLFPKRLRFGISGIREEMSFRLWYAPGKPWTRTAVRKTFDKGHLLPDFYSGHRTARPLQGGIFASALTAGKSANLSSDNLKYHANTNNIRR
jgi:hypothetical protein